MANDIKLGYQEHSLDDVFKFFADGFKPKPGVAIVRYETFVDIQRGVVIFKISFRMDGGDTAKIITLQG